MHGWVGWVEIVWLRVFREVARQGSFTAAANALRYTQSAVSRQIAALEGDTGVALFDRVARGVRLTHEGRCLLEHAEAVLGRLETARKDLVALRDLDVGRLRIGAFATADAALVPRAMATFHAEHPNVTLSLTESLTSVQVGRLRDGDLDVGVLSVAPGRSLDTDGLDLTHLLDDPILVAIPREHRLARRRTIRLAELADEPWIAGWQSPEDTLIGTALPTGVQPEIRYVVPGWTAKLGLVAAGLGVTLVPGLAAGGIARTDILIKWLSPQDTPARAVYAAVPAKVTRPPAVQRFLHILTDTVCRLGAELAERSPGRGRVAFVQYAR
ncbi:MAG TPA: LysR family transcriptional regulator [Actinophytocola sp.]|uniref:LysR family transcriptional regulator n=1 Tax=Actinophytocola sp. TaxID=1872138 RepID=UPI002DB75535|nr:LysR family transcriptional regulator [Actinophytocola sp.]HEU5471370.1 LysR family transcriptional regulator [Actinophytocola sp.]